MKEMKDSGIEWIGEIPKEWDTVKIKHLANREPGSFTDGDWIDSPYIVDEGIRYLTSGNIGDGEYKEQGNGHITEETFGSLNCTYAYPGDLVFSRLNTPYGRSCILPDICPKYVLAVDNVILRTDEDKRFISYLTQCAGYHHEVEGKANGTAMKRISRTDLGNISLPVAPKSEQSRIADYLDKKCAEIDALIAAKEKTNALLKERRQSIIYEAVTKGLDPNAKMKDSGVEWIGEIPENAEVIRLKFYSYMKGRIGWQGLRAEDFIDEGPYCVTGTDFQNGVINWKTCYHVSEERYEMDPYIQIQNGDLLITKDGTIGKLAKVDNLPGKACLNSHLLIIRSMKNKFTNEYLYYVLSSDVFWNYYKKISYGTIMESISQEKMEEFSFPVYSLDEQNLIIQYLNAVCSRIDDIIVFNESTIEKLKEFRQSVIYEAVTGKVEV